MLISVPTVRVTVRADGHSKNLVTVSTQKRVTPRNQREILFRNNYIIPWFVDQKLTLARIVFPLFAGAG